MIKSEFIPEAAIFDMDGLMLDTERPCISAWIAAGKKLGIKIEEKVPLSAIGRDRDAIRRIFKEALGEDLPFDELKAEMWRLVNIQVEKEGLKHRPGLITILDHLKSQGIPIAVATSTHRERAEKRLDFAGIRDRFGILVGGDEIENGKPEPDIFLLAAKKLGKDPSVCVGFEDSPAGLRSLAAAGIRSVFIKDLVEPPPEVLATVWKRFETLAYAVELFQKG